jgi:hypothetical protein
VPVLARKPGALRNGAPFKDWLLPAGLERMRRKLQGSNDGDRQMVKVLSAVLTDGLAAVAEPAPSEPPAAVRRFRFESCPARLRLEIVGQVGRCLGPAPTPPGRRAKLHHPTGPVPG